MVLEANGDGLEADEVFETRTGVEISPEQMLNAVLARMTWGWSPQPVDNTDVYRRRVATANGGTIMPCSPGVDGYKVDGWFGGQSLTYNMEWRWRPGVLEFLKTLPRQQILHRSRQIALSAKPLIAGELDRRAQKLHDNRAQLDELRSSVQHQLMAELSTMVLQETLKHMSYNWPHIQEYISEHETRGTGTGYKWGELMHLGDSGWRAVYERITEYLEDALHHQGEYVTGLFETGIRARSDPLTMSQILAGKVTDTTKSRDRMVMFRAILSMEGAFLLNKPAWYKSMMEKAIDILDFNYHVDFPMVIGGQAYIKAADNLRAGLTQSAYDGGSWEAVVGALFGGELGWATTSIDGWVQEPSGWYNTTGINSIATLIAAKKLLSQVQFGKRDKIKLIILSDDLNIYHTGKPVENKLLGQLEEFQPDDTSLQFMLGVAYAWNPAKPRILGFKVTTDRADKSIPYRWDSLGYFEEEVNGKADERQTLMWLNLYQGMFGTKTLLKAIGDIQADKFRGGSELVHEMAESQYESVNVAELRGQLQHSGRKDW